MAGVVTLQYGLQNVGRVRCLVHIICRDRDTVPPCWIHMAWTRNSGHDDIIGSGGSFNTRRRDLLQDLDLQIFAALGFRKHGSCLWGLVYRLSLSIRLDCPSIARMASRAAAMTEMTRPGIDRGPRGDHSICSGHTLSRGRSRSTMKRNVPEQQSWTAPYSKLSIRTERF